MERREKYSRPLKRVFVPLLTLALVLTTAVIPSDSMKARNMAYADTNTNQVTLTAALVQSADKTTDRVALTIGVETIENLQLSGVQFRVEYPDEFTLIEKEVKDFFENGVSFFGPFKGEPNVTETARPMFCGFGSHGTNDEQREYVIKQKGDLVTLVFEANKPLDKEKQYTFSIQDADATSHPEAFLLTTNAETNKPETLYYDITNAVNQIYKPTHSGGTIAEAGTTITAEVDTTDPTTNKTTIKKQVIAKALKNAGTDTADIVIDATTNDTQTKPQTKLELSKASMGAVAEQEKSLILQTNAGQLNFSTAAAAGIHNKTDGENLVITVSKKDEIKIDQNQTAAAVDFAVTAELVSGDNTPTPVTSFGGGEVEVTLDLPTDLQGQNLICWYYTDKNYAVVDRIDTDDKTKFVFKTKHFSKYMVATQPTLDAFNNGVRTPGVTVGGTAISWDNVDNAKYLLYPADSEDDFIKSEWKNGTYTTSTTAIQAVNGEAAREITLNNKKMYKQDFKFDSVTDNTYKLAIFKEGKYVPKIVTITISSGAVAEDLSAIKLWLYGDVNYDGKVRGSDATQIQRSLVHLRTFTDEEALAADVNCDGKVRGTDVTQIQRMLVHMSSCFDELR